MRCLCDPTPSGWCKTDAHSTDFASNWLKRLPAGSISTWEDLTTCFLAQFFPLRKTAKLWNDIMMFQQHQEKRLSSLRTQLRQQQDDMMNKVDTLWMVVSEKFSNTPAHDTTGNFMACVNVDIKSRMEGVVGCGKLLAFKSVLVRGGRKRVCRSDMDASLMGKVVVGGEDVRGRNLCSEVRRDWEKCMWGLGMVV
ncbi:zinc finger, CCHC-type containing protein [Tanacetum coccineum]|uniref:Zinc finger, CCHC-type containing protein n=1 Tax=Tanacetum coccineum TaxID=301880 RepID=A0ABQ5F7R8_9ASTR